MIQAERLWKWVAMHDYFAGDFMWTGIDYLGESFWPVQGVRAPARSTSPAAQGRVLPVPEPVDRPAGAPPLPALELAGAGGAGDPGAGVHQLQQRGAVPQRPLAGREAPRVPGAGHLGRLEQLRAAGRATPRPTTCTSPGTCPTSRACCGPSAAARWRREPASPSVRTAGPPAAIRLSVDRDTVTAAPGDVAHVTFEIVDSAGTVVPTAGERRDASRSRAAASWRSTTPTCRTTTPYQTDHRHAFNGRGLAILRAAQPGLLARDRERGRPTAGEHDTRCASGHRGRGGTPGAVRGRAVVAPTTPAWRRLLAQGGAAAQIRSVQTL